MLRNGSMNAAGRSTASTGWRGQFGDGYAAWVSLTMELSSLDGATPLRLLAGGEIDRVAKAGVGDRPGDFA
jgi:hypothetical protein